MKRSTPCPTGRWRPSWPRVIWLLAGMLLLYAIVPSLGSFQGSWQRWSQARPGLVALALACFLLAYLPATLMYQLLARRRMPLSRTLLVQLAASFAGKLLPAGAGALGLNYEYLRKQRHTPLQAGVAVSLNNALGFIGNGILLLICWLTGTIAWPRAHQAPTAKWWWIVGTAVVLVLLLGWYLSGRKSLVSAIHALRRIILTYRRHPGRLLLALAVSVCLTALYVTVLWSSCQALRIGLDWPTALVVLSLGVASGTIIPTPGGIGAAEAGLTSTLVWYGHPAAPALAAVLLYRLITYWLPLLLGGAAFIQVLRRRYIALSV